MRTLSLLAIAALAFSAQLPVAAQSKTFTCGRDFAQLGESKTVVQMKCGKPAAASSFCRKIDTVHQNSPQGVPIHVQTCENVDEWTYRPGPGQFVTMLRFREGELVEINYGPRM